MDINKFTQKAQEALMQAQNLAGERGHSEVDTEHLLHSLLTQQDGLIPRLLEKMDLQPRELAQRVEALIDKRPQVSGAGYSADKLHLSARLGRLLSSAEKEARRLKDEYTSVEHLLLEMLRGDDASPVGQLLKAQA